MNLLDSHDTERLLWTLTPGPETTAGREGTPANVAAGKHRVRLASLIQFTVPGAPTVYYGDEVGLTGDDDPDDRRTYPWADLGGTPDTALLAHYTALAALRDDVAALTDGDFRVLLANDADETVAYGRKTGSRRRGRRAQPLVVGADCGASRSAATCRTGRRSSGGSASAWPPPAASRSRGARSRSRSRRCRPRARDRLDRPDRPAAPTNLHVTGEGANELSVAWDGVAGAAGTTST